MRNREPGKATCYPICYKSSDESTVCAETSKPVTILDLRYPFYYPKVLHTPPNLLFSAKPPKKPLKAMRFLLV